MREWFKEFLKNLATGVLESFQNASIYNLSY